MLSDSPGYLRLRRELMNGSYVPGQRMSSRALAAKLGITRPEVRNALRQMAREGVVKPVPQSGVYLRHATRDHMEHICEMREAIEPNAAKWAAKRITPQQIRALYGVCDELHKIELEFRASGKPFPSKQTLRRISRLDLRFHLLVIRAAGNPLAYRTIRNFQVLATLFGLDGELPGPRQEIDLGAYRRWHTGMARAIERRDGQAAKALMEQHVIQGKELALKKYDEMNRATSTKVQVQVN